MSHASNIKEFFITRTFDGELSGGSVKLLELRSWERNFKIWETHWLIPTGVMKNIRGSVESSLVFPRLFGSVEVVGA